MLINLKYELNYGNISGDTYKCQIFKVGAYDGDVIQLDGYCVHSYKSVNNIFEPIRGASLNISFVASLEEPFADFNVVQEFQFFVVFFRNDIAIFTGWILPDGISQSYVKDNWEVTLQAVDGLGFLKNYEYLPEVTVNLPESNPLLTDVYHQEFNILYTILERVGYNIPIATFDNINQGFNTTTGEPFAPFDFANIDRRIVNKEVFLNKNENYFDCETILKDILQKYNFNIFQGVANNELCWIITRPHFQLTANIQKGSIWKPASVDGNKIIFERDSTFLSNTSTIFSNYDTENGLLHCNENQIINYKPAIQNFRFDQKWLGLKNYGVSLTDVDYDVTSSGSFVSEGIESDPLTVPITLAATQDTPIFYSKDSGCNVLIEIKTLFRVTVDVPIGNRSATMFYRIRAVNINDSEVLYLSINDEGRTEWTPTLTRLRTNTISFDGTGDYIVETKYESPEINNFEVFVDIYEYQKSGTVTLTVITTDINVFFRPLSLGLGEYHDSKLVNFKSSFLNEPVKVINSNQNDDVFLNNLYLNVDDELLVQNSWNLNNAFPYYDDLLELTSRERLTMLSRPQMIFAGDVYGYLPYFNRIIYDKIEGQFLILNYSFNSKTNVTRLECSQAFIESVEKTYTQTYYFEDEKNVLIKEIN